MPHEPTGFTRGVPRVVLIACSASLRAQRLHYSGLGNGMSAEEHRERKETQCSLCSLRSFADTFHFALLWSCFTVHLNSSAKSSKHVGQIHL